MQHSYLLDVVRGVLNWGAAVLWLASGSFWVISTYVSRPVPKAPGGGYEQVDLTEWVSGEPIDILATAKRQAVWNRYAAMTAALAALFQAGVLFVGTSS